MTSSEQWHLGITDTLRLIRTRQMSPVPLLTRDVIAHPSRHSLARPCSPYTTYHLAAGSGSQTILCWHLLDTPILRQLFQVGGDILLGTAPQSCRQVGWIDVPGNCFYRA